MPKTKNTPGIHLYKTIVKRKVGAKFQYRSEYYWNIVASNGREIARSSETYTTKRAAVRSIRVASKIFCTYPGWNSFYDNSGKDSPLVNYLG